MKKFFSLCVLAVSALFGLTCCSGGGNDSDADYMSINDFARGGKKFRCGYQLQLDIEPFGTDGNMSKVGETYASSIPGRLQAGTTPIPVNLTYKMAEKDSRQATLTFQVTDNADQLSDRNLLAGLGFAVSDTDANGELNVQTGQNKVTSISGINCTLYFDFDAREMRCTGTYQGRAVSEDGNPVGPITSFEIVNSAVPFVVGF